MRTRLYWLAVLFSLLLIVEKPALASENGEHSEFRGLWVATVLRLDYPSATGLSTAQLKAEADNILNTAVETGFNAVILQVRPTADALYPSTLYPWSAWLTGTQGQAPAGGFDPLAYWVEQAHARGLELHAWVNPYRITRTQTELSDLAKNHPARLHPEWVVRHGDFLYFDPGIPEVRQLVVDGVTELLDNYDIDGIQFDDYFYPGTDFDDAASFAAHGGGFTEPAGWRRENVNKLIRAVHLAMKDSGRVFGVSPSGIWANSSTSPFGSDTHGYESYTSAYADTRRWVKNGWLDYIAPQIYWEIGHSKADFAKLTEWWSALVEGTGVKLYIGHATYRSGEGGAWRGTAEIERQIAYVRADANVSGSLHFRYRFVAENSDLRKTLSGLYETAGYIPPGPAAGAPMTEPPIGGLSIGRPAENMTVSHADFYIMGASDPAQTVTCNGEAVTDRTENGYFGFVVTLKKGENVFTFKQGGQTVTRRITYGTGGTGGGAATMAKPGIENAHPLAEEYARPGQSITLQCSAPIGAAVYAHFLGQVIRLTPAAAKAPDSDAVYRTTYTAELTLPAPSGGEHILHLGTPLYTMDYDGRYAVRAAAGAVRVILPDAGLYAEIVSPFAFVYPKASTSGGSNGELSQGQLDFAEAVTSSGQWVKLASAGWVAAADVRLRTGRPGSQARAAITAARYTRGGDWDTLTLDTAFPGATTLTLDGQVLTMTVSGVTAAPIPALPAGGSVQAVTARVTASGAEYTLTLTGDTRLDGCYVEAAPGELSLRLKTPKAAGTGERPLTGFVILVDAGHGGTDMGAIGPWSEVYTEEYFNLAAARKLKLELEALGAAVRLTRDADTAVTPQERVMQNWRLKPDLFISLHCNSMGYETDTTNITGLSTWYRQPHSLAISQLLHDHAQSSLGLRKRGANQSNLYVCRPNWTPCLIVEMGFICSPSDYEWLSSDEKQNRLAATLAQGILLYFS